MAAVTLASGGNRQSSRQMWQSIEQTATVEYQRNHAHRALAQLDALDQVDALRPIVERFARETGTSPRDWQPLARAGVLLGIPVDPAGVPYRILPDGSIDVDPASPLSPLPKEPQRTAVERGLPRDQRRIPASAFGPLQALPVPAVAGEHQASEHGGQRSHPWPAPAWGTK